MRRLSPLKLPFPGVAFFSDSPRKLGTRYVDMRSDTVTKPTAQMSLAMMDASLGDDVFAEDPTVNAFQRYAAEFFGKEEALFVPSGTMGNLISVGVHCGRGEEALLGQEAHIYRYEAGGAAALMGVPLYPLPNAADGTIAIADMEAALKPDDAHFPATKLVCLENTQNRCGGAVLPPAYVADVAAFCADNNLVLHVDGARLMNAVVASKISPQDALEGVDSASVCLSKALGAPVGSVIVGTSDFIYRARRLRKMLGGGMRQVGVIAAAGKIALEEHSKLLENDHKNAQALARGLQALPGVSIAGGLPAVQSNIMFVTLDEGTYGPDAAETLASRMSQEHHVMMGVYGTHRLRCVTHFQVTRDDIDKALVGLGDVLASW